MKCPLLSLAPGCILAAGDKSSLDPNHGYDDNRGDYLPVVRAPLPALLCVLRSSGMRAPCDARHSGRQRWGAA